MKNEYTTADVAKTCGTYKMYLLRLIYSGRLPEVRVVQLGKVKVRFWSSQDLIRAASLIAQLKEKKRKKEQAS